MAHKTVIDVHWMFFMGFPNYVLLVLENARNSNLFNIRHFKWCRLTNSRPCISFQLLAAHPFSPDQAYSLLLYIERSYLNPAKSTSHHIFVSVEFYKMRLAIVLQNLATLLFWDRFFMLFLKFVQWPQYVYKSWNTLWFWKMFGFTHFSSLMKIGKVATPGMLMVCSSLQSWMLQVMNKSQKRLEKVCNSKATISS